MDSKNKLVRAISAEELQGFLSELAGIAGVDGPTIQRLAEEKFGVEMGHNSANHFRKEVYQKYLETIGKRKALVQMITAHQEPRSGQTLADAASDQLQQQVFEFLIDAETGIDLSTPEGMKQAKDLSAIIKSARSEDRRMIESMQKTIDETKDDLTNRALTEAQREARIRERFGV
jgi:hypothetical protein